MRRRNPFDGPVQHIRNRLIVAISRVYRLRTEKGEGNAAETLHSKTVLAPFSQHRQEDTPVDCLRS